MAHPINFLAFDLGAESGRAMLAEFDGERLRLSQVHRFPNGPVILPDGLHWDVLRLWSEIKHGLATILREGGKNLASIGLDTWGVDFALLDQRGALVSNPYHYRDSRTDGMLEEAFRRVPREEIFEQTGIQFMPINSLYQLLSMVVRRSPALDIVHTFLTIPDLFNYWLTGRQVCEFSNATTTQCYDPRNKDWAWPLLEGLSIPAHMFHDVVPPGTVLGQLLPSVAEEAGLPTGADLAVVAPACHDTGSAFAAVPTEGSDFACISSGTWSIVGTELSQPVINARTLEWNFTNEGGVCDTIRLLKNVAGLWLVQQCRATWASRGESHSYAELTQMAADAPPFQAIIDPDYGEFLKPGDMPARIRSYCQATNQPVLEEKGAIIRSVLEGLALKYRLNLERLEKIVGKELHPLHIVGGGTQNTLLNQLTADATGRLVLTGPVEATALGNVLMQALATGHIHSLSEGRELIRRSFTPAVYEPGDPAPWDEAYGRFLAL